ncbi:MAG: D-2-hydroxyacid dehydrogenase [Deltaproteobacteria bacterium]|jgi:glycerate dehydrogenase|nr:D-2-hydroxyacid dehydrogenase [Deltaproteobacteria bacterium]
MINIVVLDGGAVNPGDISWNSIKLLSDSFKYYPRTEEGEILERSKGAQILLTNKTPLSRKTLKALPDLKYIGVIATGYNVVDVKAAKELGIPVTNVPGYGSAAVAQYAIGLLLEITLHIGHHSHMVKKGRWQESRDFCFWDIPLSELDGKTMGIVGLGAIGSKVARISLALGMKVVAYNGPRAPKGEHPGVELVELAKLFREADVISLHAPLNKDNIGLINLKSLSLMKDGVLIVNTARGALINEEALAKALKSGKVAAAALDVLCSEPPTDDNPLLNLDNCLITPHLAWSPREARLRLMEIAKENIRKFLEGTPVNVVNP